MLAVASTNKSAESAKRLHENLKNCWPVAYQEREPPGQLYQTPAPHAQSITFRCAARKTLCLPYALVEVGGCAREEQEGICSMATGLPETKTGAQPAILGAWELRANSRLRFQRGADRVRPFCNRSVSMSKTKSGERIRVPPRKNRGRKEEKR